MYNTYSSYSSGASIGTAIISLIVTIGIRCVLGAIANSIASKKGYDHGFAWGFWLGVIGIIVCAVREDRSYYKSSSSDDYWNRVRNGSAAPAPTGWTCKCGATNPISVDYCLSCRRSKAESEKAKQTVKCPHCGANNDPGNVTCFACGKPMKEEPRPIAAPSYTPIQPTVTLDKAAPSEPAVSKDPENALALIERLGKLHDAGMLTDEEYSEKKKELLKKV